MPVQTLHNLHAFNWEHAMPSNPRLPLRMIATFILVIGIVASLTACKKQLFKPTATTPPSPIDFAQAVQYAQRSALVYEADAVIRQKAPAGTTVSIMPETATGIKAYV